MAPALRFADSPAQNFNLQPRKIAGRTGVRSPPGEDTERPRPSCAALIAVAVRLAGQLGADGVVEVCHLSFDLG